MSESVNFGTQFDTAHYSSAITDNGREQSLQHFSLLLPNKYLVKG